MHGKFTRLFGPIEDRRERYTYIDSGEAETETTRDEFEDVQRVENFSQEFSATI